MAGDAVVGALRVVLGMDTASFEDGAKKGAKALDSFGKRMSEVAAGIGLEKAIQRTVRALSDLTFGIINSADSIGKMSQKFGVGVEQLSGLKYAAEQADVPLDTLAKGFKNLSIEMVKAQTGAITDASTAFKLLGIDVTKFGGDANAALLAVAEKLSGFEDGMNKAALASAIFGKRIGPDMLPFLNMGRGGIEQLTDRAKQLGLVLTKETTDAAQVFNDRLKDIGAIVVGVATQFLATFLPALSRIVDGFTKWAIESDIVKKSSEGLARIVFLLMDNMTLLLNVFKTWLALKIITFVAEIGVAFIALTKAVGALALGVVSLNLASLLTLARFAAIVGVFAVVSGMVPEVTTGLAKIGDALAKMLPPETKDLVTKGLDAIGFKVDALTEDFMKLKEQASGTFDIPIPPGFQRPQAPLLDTQRMKDEMKTLEQIFEAARDRGIALTEELRTPLEELADRTSDITRLRGLDFISLETWGRAQTKIALDTARVWGEVASSIVSPMADAFKTLASMNKKFAGAAKALAIAEALVNTYLAATKALASGVPPFNYIAAAAVTAAGLANVAKISATQFATGGSFRVGGGMGGVDSQLISMALTPGEMVDVRRPGQERSTVTEITVNMRGRDIFNGDAVRDLFDAINQGTADGYRLRVAG